MVSDFADVAAGFDRIASAENRRALVEAAPGKLRAPREAVRYLFAAGVGVVISDIGSVAVAELFLQKAENAVANAVFDSDVGVNACTALELTVDPRTARGIRGEQSARLGDGCHRAVFAVVFAVIRCRARRDIAVKVKTLTDIERDRVRVERE